VRTTNTAVLARRVRIHDEYATLPHEAGWASEAVFFTQAEGDHPTLEIVTEVSPDGIHWIPRGGTQTLDAQDTIIDSTLTTFGNWVRLRITGADQDHPARILVHLNLKS
jgi:hypothetical protein